MSNDYLYLLFIFTVLATGLSALWRPGSAMALIMCMYAIKQALQSRYYIFTEHSLITNVTVAGVAFSSLLISRSRGVRLGRKMDRISMLALFVVVFGLSSALWGRTDAIVRARWVYELSYIILLVFLLPSLLTREEDFYAAVRTYLWLGSITVCVLLFMAQWTNRLVHLERSDMGGLAFTSLSSNPLEVSTLAMRVIFILLLLNLRGLGKFWVVMRWVVGILAVWLLIRSSSRGQIIVMCGILAVLFPLSKSYRDAKSLFSTSIVLAGMLGVFYAIYQSTTLDARWSSDNVQQALGVRTGYVSQAMSHWLNYGPFRLLFGWGVDADFDLSFTRYFPEVGPAELLSDLGLIGFIPWALCVASAGRKLGSLYLLVRHDEFRRGYVVVLGAIAGALFLLSFKESAYFWILGWCIMISRYDYLVRRSIAEQSATEVLEDPALLEARGELVLA